MFAKTAKLCASRGVTWLVEDSVKRVESRSRMREIFKSGSVGRVSGNRCLYLENQHKKPGDFIISQYFLKITFAKAAVGFLCD